MWRVGQLLPDGQDAGIANAKEVWGEKLAGFAGRPECIKRALESLPQHPPTLPEFIVLCRQFTPALPPMLTAPHPGKEARKRNLDAVKEVVRRMVN